MRGRSPNDVGRDLDLVQFNAVPGGDLPRINGVVRHGFQPLVLGAERDRVRIDPWIGPVRQDGNDAGVEAAGQEARDRHVGYQVSGDRLLDHRPQVRRRPGRGLGRHVRDTPVAPKRGASIRAEARPRASGKLLHAVDGTQLLGHPVVEHRRHQSTRSDPQLRTYRRHQRLELRCEHHAIAARKVVQRLDAERVTRQDEFTGALIKQCEREHAAEAAQGLRSP